MSTADARHCERLTRRHARTFYLASLLLPGVKRRGTYALYAFCRMADDLVDGSRAESAHPSPARQLEAYRAHLESALQGRPDGPVFRELAWAVSHFGLPVAALHELLDGVATDLTRSRWDSWPELERYCQGVAGSVGEMCVWIFGATPDPTAPDAVVSRARALGVAMQLTNILRDVGEDAGRGRCYLPAEELIRHQLTPDEILSGHLDPADARWQAMMAFQVERARRWFAAAAPGFANLEPDAQRCAHACAIGYSRILLAIERNGYDSLRRRASLGWIERTAVLGRCIFGATGAARATSPDDPAVIPAA
jgi:phytoene synthase